MNESGSAAKNGGLLALSVGLLIILAVGALLGFCRGALGDGGSTSQGMDWAIKTGLLYVVMSVTVGLFASLVLSRTKRVPAIVGWALAFSLAFGMMKAGEVVLGMNDEEFWPTTLTGMLEGAVIGAIAGPLIERNQLKTRQS